MPLPSSQALRKRNAVRHLRVASSPAEMSARASAGQQPELQREHQTRKSSPFNVRLIRALIGRDRRVKACFDDGSIVILESCSQSFTTFNACGEMLRQLCAYASSGNRCVATAAPRHPGSGLTRQRLINLLNLAREKIAQVLELRNRFVDPPCFLAEYSTKSSENTLSVCLLPTFEVLGCVICARLRLARET